MATGGKIIVIEDSSDVLGGCVTLRSCEPCMKDNTSTDATQFCTVCNEFLCDDCKRGHSRFKPGKHSFTIAQDVTEVKVVVDMKDMDKCEEHKKKIKFFCKDHSLLCCSTCAFIHRTCKNVDELAKISEEKGELLHELKKDLVQAAGKESEIINDCIQTILSLQEKLLEFPKEIEELRETLNTLFANTITVINNQANDAVRDETKRLSERQTLSEQVLNDINDVLPVCTAVVDNGTPQQVFILARSIEKILNEINIHDDKRQSKHFTLQLSLNFTKEISTLLQTGSDFVKLESLRINPNTAGELKDEIDEIMTSQFQALNLGMVKDSVTKIPAANTEATNVSEALVDDQVTNEPDGDKAITSASTALVDDHVTNESDGDKAITSASTGETELQHTNLSKEEEGLHTSGYQFEQQDSIAPPQTEQPQQDVPSKTLTGKDDLGILLVGLPGHGTSATGNSLMGKSDKHFTEKDSTFEEAYIQTRVRVKDGINFKRKIKVVEFTMKNSLSQRGEDFRKLMLQAEKLLNPGFHAVCFVLDPNKMADVNKQFQPFMEFLASDYAFIIMTRTKNQKECERHFTTKSNPKGAGITSLFRFCKDKVLFIDNKAERKDTMVQAILTFIDSENAAKTIPYFSSRFKDKAAADDAALQEQYTSSCSII